MSRMDWTPHGQDSSDEVAFHLWVKRFDRWLFRMGVVAIGVLVSVQALTSMSAVRNIVDLTTSGFSYSKSSPMAAGGALHIVLYVAPSQVTSGIQVYEGTTCVGDFAKKPSVELDVQPGQRIRIRNATTHPCLVAVLTESRWQTTHLLGKVFVQVHSESTLPIRQTVAS